MTIVEYKKDIDLFLNRWDSESSTVIPIWSDLQKHPMDNCISFLYVRFSDEAFIIPYNHNDCEPIQIDISKSTQPKWVWDKKGLLQSELGIQNTYDIQTHIYFTTNQLYDFNSKLEDITSFYSRLGMHDDLGKTIPIMKFIEVLDSVFIELSLNENFENNWVDGTMIPLLSEIECNGLNVDTKKFLERWPDQAKFLKAGKIYTEYNPYTPTTRPSNRHAGINFGALNKKDGTRECFIPSDNHIFLQFDYDAYHIRIISKLIHYDIPHKSGHQWLADQYGCSYEDSKGRTFRIIYGGVSDEDKQIPFFKQIDDYIQKLWQTMETQGYIETPMKRKIYMKFIDNPYPQKVFNYLLQSIETELNMKIIKKLYESGHMNMVLYQYDSFLFDFSKENIGKAKEIQEIIESNGFSTKVSWGEDYSKV